MTHKRIGLGGPSDPAGVPAGPPGPRGPHLMISAAILFLLIGAGSAGTGTAEKPVLFIVHSDSCLPCRVFDRVFCNRDNFQTALRRACELRELDWDVPAQRAAAVSLGVDRLPTYVVVRRGQIVAKHIGFTSSSAAPAVDRAIAELMASLRIEWPPAEPEAAPRPAPRTPAPGPASPAPAASPVAPVVDRDAREAITRLATQSQELAENQQKTQRQVEALGAGLQEIRQGVDSSTRDLRSQIDTRASESSTQLEAITQTLRQTIGLNASTREDLQTFVREQLEQRHGQPATGHGISTEITPAAPAAAPGESPTASKWLRVLTWVGKTGLSIAAPEIAIPGSLGLTVAGLGLRWLIRRRQPKPIGTAENPIRVNDAGEVRTETKYVVSETDVMGEAYKEAIRRVGNANRETAPHVVDLLKQVDAAAGQLAHGKRIVRRPSTAPVSENDP